MLKKRVETVDRDYICGFLPSLKKLIILLYHDFLLKRDKRKQGIVDFNLYGMRVYSGRQGSGKTMGMVDAIARARDDYPGLTIVTNFACKYADKQLKSLNDLLTIKNGSAGVLFAIDEMQNEFSSKASKDFPENLLELITQQRKQRIAIFCTSQVFTRLAKPLREQTYEVCTCKTSFGGRLTRIKCYDAIDYMGYIESDNEAKRARAIKKWSHTFVQTDELRNAYDTYSVIKRLSRQGFTDKQWGV